MEIASSHPSPVVSTLQAVLSNFPVLQAKSISVGSDIEVWFEKMFRFSESKLCCCSLYLLISEYSASMVFGKVGDSGVLKYSSPYINHRISVLFDSIIRVVLETISVCHLCRRDASLRHHSMHGAHLLMW